MNKVKLNLLVPREAYIALATLATIDHQSIPHIAEAMILVALGIKESEAALRAEWLKGEQAKADAEWAAMKPTGSWIK